MFPAPRLKITMENNEYKIRVWKNQHLKFPQEWQADCGDDHALGCDPLDAVEKLLSFIALLEHSERIGKCQE